MPYAFVLVHSPIVGPDTWEPVAAELRASGYEVVVPALEDDGSPPFWPHHLRCVSLAVERELDRNRSVVAVAHSGAGQIMGSVGAALRELGHDINAYIFADAGLPTHGSSRLQQLRKEAPEFAQQLVDLFEAGRGFPDWGEELLRELVPHDERRRRLAAGIRQLPYVFWEEPIPTPPSWPDAPCGVLFFSGGYEATAKVAQARNWPLRRVDAANHFYMLVQPDLVAHHLLELTAQATGSSDR